MAQFTFSRQFVDEVTRDPSRPQRDKDGFAVLLQRFHLILLPVLVCLVALPQANAQFAQQGSKLVGTGAVGSAYQGQSVSLSSDGNTAIVGGVGDNSNAGAVWVWTRSGGVWTQQGSKLVGTGAVGSAYQGNSVSLSSDGNTAIAGGNGDSSNAGAAWVWTRSGGVWTQQGSKLVGTGAVGAQQGRSVSLSSDGNTAIVGGALDNSSAGAAWVWTRSGGAWTQQGSKLVGTGAVGSAYQGQSVSLSSDGNTAIVGGFGDNTNAGAVWVFTRSGGVWTQQGSKLVGTGAVGNAYQGNSASLSSDGNTAIVGGNLDNSSAGAAWVWTRSGGAWTQQGSKLVGTGAVGNAFQGRVSLSSDGNTAIVGGPLDNSSAGAAWIWTRSGGVWTQQGSKLVGTGALGSAQKGISVAISSDGNTAIIGGYNDNTNAGAAWVYKVAPSAPVNLVVTDSSSTKIGIRWRKNTVADFLRYRIYRGTSPNPTTRVDSTTGGVADTSKNFTSLANGTRYYLRVTAVDSAGNESPYSNEVNGAPNAALAVENALSQIPKEYSLSQNYPNPFNPSTIIRYGLPVRSHVTIEIYSILGQRVTVLTDEVQDAHFYEKTWQASVSSGLYFYRLAAVSIEDPNKSFVQVRKMLLLK